MKYYYLIASLPELKDIHTTLSDETFADTVERIERNLDDTDRGLFRYMKFPQDHSNIISQVLEEFHKVKMPYIDTFAVYPKDTIRYFRKYRNSLPDYMAEFISECEDRFANCSIRELENDLHSRFLKVVMDSESEFIREYFVFDHNLRSIAALINARIFSHSVNTDYMEDRIRRNLGHGSMIPNEIKAEFTYIESLQAALESQHPDMIIEAMDSIRWSYIEERIGTKPFTTDHVFGYFLKLMIIKRRSSLEQAGQQKTLMNILESAALTSKHNHE